MKKILKYISLVGLSSFILTGNVKAGVTVEAKPGHRTKFGYSTQTQTVTENNCTSNIYCLDKGLANQKSFAGCSAIDISNTVAGTVVGSHDEKEYQYRVIFDNSGLTRVNYSSSSIANPAVYGYGNLASATVPITTQSEGYVNYTTSSANGRGTVNATVNLGQSGYASNFEITPGGGDLNVTDNGDGSYNLTITNIPITDCEGGNAEVSVNGISSSTTVGTGSLYYVACHNSKQNYVIESNGCDINEILKKNSDSTTFKFSVADDECKCSGTSTLCQECNQDGTSSDNMDNIKGCAKNNGKFQNYCNVSVKKETDNNTGPHTRKTVRTDNVSTELGDNPYCNVFCLEEIKYNMPGLLKTKNGRYFKLKKGFELGVNEDGNNISISGTRKCVTSEIKTSTFVSNIIANEEAVVRAYNTYKYNEQYNKALDQDTTSTPSGSDCVTKDKKGNCTTYCSYTKHEVPVAARTYKKAKVSYNGSSGSVTNYGLVDDTVEEITWITDSNCSSIPNTSKPDKKTLNSNEINAALQVMYDTINKYKSCFEWTNNYCFNPKAEFSYNEVYKDANTDIPLKGDIQNGEQQTSYYIDVDQSYNGNNTGSKAETYNYIYADTSILNDSNASVIDVTTKYVKKEVKASAEFEDGTVDIYSYHPYGTISYDKNCINEGKCTYLGKVLPVALQHDPDAVAYEYSIKFKNVGVAGDDATCPTDDSEAHNRINGSSCSLTSEEAGCESDYSCQYETTSCPECEIECVCPENSKNCYVEDKVCKYKECPDCKVECIGCIFDRGNTTVSYKTISLNNVYKNDEDIGSNWTQEEVKEIEDKGQEVYNEEPQYSFNLTPQTMSKIREYNKISVTGSANSQNIPKGGYNNDTLKCTIDGTNAKNCKSSFLREYLDKNVINGSLPDNW